MVLQEKLTTPEASKRMEISAAQKVTHKKIAIDDLLTGERWLQRRAPLLGGQEKLSL